MSKITTTAWQRVYPGQTTQLDLTAMSHYISARVRWRGADNPYIVQTVLTASGTTAAFRAVEEGRSFVRHAAAGSVYVRSFSYETLVFLVKLNIGGTSYAQQYNLSPGSQGTYSIQTGAIYTYMPGATVSVSTEVISGTGSMSTSSNNVSAYTTQEQTLTQHTTDPSVTIAGETAIYYGFLTDGAVSSWYTLDGLIKGMNSLYHNMDERSAADIQIEYTYEPLLPYTEQDAPEHATSTADTTVNFDFVLTADAENSAEKYHARIRFANFSTMPSATVYESKESQAGWNYWDGAAWQPFPSGGVDPDTLVRYTKTFPLSTIYWDTASWDGYSYGLQGTPYKVRLVLTADSLYTLEIDGQRYNARALRVTEACNGEIGGISMVLDNKDGTAYSTIAYGDTVILALSVNGQDQDFEGVVREINPSGAEVEVTAILGDGILAERIVKEDYASQDIGLIIKDIIETYCAPLTAANVDTATGFSAPIPANGKTPLAVFEDIRKNYGTYYYVDKNWDLHFYKTVSDDAVIRISRGAV